MAITKAGQTGAAQHDASVSTAETQPIDARPTKALEASVTHGPVPQAFPRDTVPKGTANALTPPATTTRIPEGLEARTAQAILARHEFHRTRIPGRENPRYDAAGVAEDLHKNWTGSVPGPAVLKELFSDTRGLAQKTDRRGVAEELIRQLSDDQLASLNVAQVAELAAGVTGGNRPEAQANGTWTTTESNGVDAKLVARLRETTAKTTMWRELLDDSKSFQIADTKSPPATASGDVLAIATSKALLERHTFFSSTGPGEDASAIASELSRNWIRLTAASTPPHDVVKALMSDKHVLDRRDVAEALVRQLSNEQLASLPPAQVAALAAGITSGNRPTTLANGSWATAESGPVDAKLVARLRQASAKTTTWRELLDGSNSFQIADTNSPPAGRVPEALVPVTAQALLGRHVSTVWRGNFYETPAVAAELSHNWDRLAAAGLPPQAVVAALLSDQYDRPVRLDRSISFDSRVTLDRRSLAESLVRQLSNEQLASLPPAQVAELAAGLTNGDHPVAHGKATGGWTTIEGGHVDSQLVARLRSATAKAVVWGELVQGGNSFSIVPQAKARAQH